jgi:hypothetical protein
MEDTLAAILGRPPRAVPAAVLSESQSSAAVSKSINTPAGSRAKVTKSVLSASAKTILRSPSLLPGPTGPQPLPEDFPLPKADDFGPGFRSRAKWRSSLAMAEDSGEHARRWYDKHRCKPPFSFSRQQRKDLRRWFDFIDDDGSGEISVPELSDPLLSTGA